ncbi:recombinase family protein [Sphingomonas yantingensis]|uniref:DNA invertase Pin-like site-specific DNA recombinase n=1 Tax=Sphingomonas yantingensis TaxID=1241761 RepID=A0A7W9EGI9_9SPHN|nr:recombinase family protein [Sphingomonas yantingensis]MBB5697183.1 DNA invertase Pin-like site-specific DNA recombinase [Sphingomonas yantingensis]
MRTAIYARFSSDQQNPRSTADQIALCRARCEKEGWSVVATFEDAATSGAAGIDQHQRPGLSALLDLVEAGAVDQVLAESTDRLSRHVADAHMIRERVEFVGARVFTLFDGVVTPMIGLIKGFTDAQFRNDLAARVKRGQRGTIQEGRSAGSISYGYRRANRIDERGELIRGLREIDPDQSAVVQRIFEEYAAGLSPRSIAGRLNAEGIPAPRGALWHTTAILGSKKSGFGVLRNQLYIGRLIYGRTRQVVDPRTRQRRMKVNTTEEPTVQDVPALRIIDQSLWEEVQALVEGRSWGRPERQRRPKHILSGMGVCGICGGPWIKVSGDHWGCAHFRMSKACTNNRLIATHLYQRRVLAELKANMLSPDAVAAYVRTYHREHAIQSAQIAADRAKIERKLGEATRKLQRLVGAVAAGGSEFVEIRALLEEARDDRDRLAKELANVDALPKVLALHPRIEDYYRQMVEQLEDDLADPDAQLDAIPRLREIIDRIVLTPGPKLRGVKLEVVRRLDEIVRMATAEPRRAELR